MIFWRLSKCDYVLFKQKIFCKHSIIFLYSFIKSYGILPYLCVSFIPFSAPKQKNTIMCFSFNFNDKLQIKIDFKI